MDKQLIKEILDNPGYPWTKLSGYNVTAYNFEFGVNKVQVDFVGSNDYDIEFSVNGDTLGGKKFRAIKNMLRFWATIKLIVKDFVKHNNPDSMFFMGTTDELENFYSKILTPLADDIGYSPSISMMDDFKVFSLKRKN